MSGYFDQADHHRLLMDYPLAQEYLTGPARLSRDALRALQEARFAKVIARRDRAFP